MQINFKEFMEDLYPNNEQINTANQAYIKIKNSIFKNEMSYSKKDAHKLLYILCAFMAAYRKQFLSEKPEVREDFNKYFNGLIDAIEFQ